MLWPMVSQAHSQRLEERSEANYKSNRLKGRIIKQCPSDNSDLHKGHSVKSR